MKLNNPLKLGKALATTAKRIGETASVAGLSALRVAKGEKMDALLLKETFERLGVTYIKLGQFIASTPTLFPKAYVDVFADCLDQTTPVDYATIETVLIEELGHMGQLEDIFSHIDKRPLASASIAQVHKAVLKTGETVALKVQKPDVGTVIATDLGVLHGTFWVLEKLLPSFKLANLAPIADEIKKRMMAETDFVAERAHLNRFHEFLAKTGNQAVTAPHVFEHLSSKRVLTMSFLDGVSLIDEAHFAKLVAPAAVMASVLDAWFLSLMSTGEFHADLHAGNLLLLKDGRVAFLDFGLVGSIDPKSLQACFTLVQAMQASDFHLAADAMVDIGMTHQRGRVDVAALAADLKRLLGKGAIIPIANPSDSSHANQQVRAQAESLHGMMLDMVEVGKRHGIGFPRDFALLTKQLLYFDRFMVTLAPDMDLFAGERMKIIHGD